MSDYLNRYKSRLGYYGKNTGESLNSNTIAFVNANFKNAPTYRLVDVYKYGEDVKQMDARVIEVERLGTLREIVLRPNETLDIGTYIKFDSDVWLLYDKYGETGSLSIKLLAIKCNNTLKWKMNDGNISEVNCTASTTDIGSKARQSKNEIIWNKYDVTLPAGQLFVTVEANELTKTITLNDRFIFGTNPYQITGIDDVTGVDINGYGLIQFTVTIDTRRINDDFVNRIAENNYKDTSTEPKDTWSLDEEKDKEEIEQGDLLW